MCGVKISKTSSYQSFFSLDNSVGMELAFSTLHGTKNSPHNVHAVLLHDTFCLNTGAT